MKTFKFDNATETVTGIETKKVKFNTYANSYLGFVKDPNFSRNATVIINNGFATGTWDKNGKCKNRNRPELDLKNPNL